MSKKSSIAIFLAATSALTISASEDFAAKAQDVDMGGLKEWNTDMPVDADYILDKRAQEIADEAKKNADLCIPIGEGENCW